MILRSLTKHVRDQNWLAVGLDFVIVVIGVGVAMIGQHWLGSRQERSDLDKAEYVLTIDLLNSYFNVVEQLSVAECRKQTTRGLTQQLLASNENWLGTTTLGVSTSDPVFGRVLTGPQRLWGSSF